LNNPADTNILSIGKNSILGRDSNNRQTKKSTIMLVFKHTRFSTKRKQTNLFQLQQYHQRLT